MKSYTKHKFVSIICVLLSLSASEEHGSHVSKVHPMCVLPTGKAWKLFDCAAAVVSARVCVQESAHSGMNITSID